MGKAEDNKRDKYERILAAARELFRTNGYDGTTHGRGGASARVSKGWSLAGKPPSRSAPTFAYPSGHACPHPGRRRPHGGGARQGDRRVGKRGRATRRAMYSEQTGDRSALSADRTQ